MREAVLGNFAILILSIFLKAWYVVDCLGFPLLISNYAQLRVKPVNNVPNLEPGPDKGKEFSLVYVGVRKFDKMC